MMKIIIEFLLKLYPYKLHIWYKGKIIGLRSLWVSSLFKQIGSNVGFGKIGCIRGGDSIIIGNNTSFDDYVYLTSYKIYKQFTYNPFIRIGNGCKFGAYNHITSTNRIEIGNNVLTGKWVTITDNAHGNTDWDDLTITPTARPMVSKGVVVIEDNVWIGDKATILSGVRIGRGAVIGANSVVTKDVPPYSVAIGSPARIVKQLK